MKCFVRTVVGKTSLFISCILTFVLLIAAVIGAYVMIEADFYTRDKEEICYELLHSHMHNDLYNTVWQYLFNVLSRTLISTISAFYIQLFLRLYSAVFHKRHIVSVSLAQ